LAKVREEFGLWGQTPLRCRFSTLTKKRDEDGIRYLELEAIGRDG
jgi:hypothetical protein